MKDLHAELIATQRADDLSYRALADISAVIAPVNARVIGGHMVQLLLAAYPTQGTITRRTGDADAGITPEAAAAGTVHGSLMKLGYRPESAGGNRYIRLLPDASPLVIDLLVKDDFNTGSPATYGAFTFDSTPGLKIPLSEPPLIIKVSATLTDRTLLEFDTKVPTIEGAVILKAYAYATRLQAKDAQDIYNLLLVARQHRETLGPWKLDEDHLAGSRLDAARYLRKLALATRGPLLRAHVNGVRLTALIRELITDV